MQLHAVTEITFLKCGQKLADTVFKLVHVFFYFILVENEIIVESY